MKHAPTPCSSTVFILDSHLSPLKSLGVRQQMIGTCILIQSMCNCIFFIFIRNHVCVSFCTFLHSNICDNSTSSCLFCLFYTPLCINICDRSLCLVLQVLICEIHVLLHFVFTFYPTFWKNLWLTLTFVKESFNKLTFGQKTHWIWFILVVDFPFVYIQLWQILKPLTSFKFFFFFPIITFFNFSNLSNANNTFPLMLNGNAFKIITIVESLPMPLCLVVAKGKYKVTLEMTSKLVITSNPPKVEAKCSELKIKRRKP